MNNKGLCGLTNLGNTCFINSCIQVLSHSEELNSFLEKDTYKSNLKIDKYESLLLIEWDKLKQIMWNKNINISPYQFIKTIQKVAKLKGIYMFQENLQNDLPEFLLFLIDCFHLSLSREFKITITGNPENEKDKIAKQCFEMIKNMYSNNYSEIFDLFYAVHISEISNLETGEKIKNTPEPYLMIDLSIPLDNKSPTLIDCLNYYVKSEVLEGENSWYNEETKEKINICKKIIFWSFPKILIIDFKRFNNNFEKNKICISFPFDELDLSDYVIGYNKEKYIYELYAVCNHIGSLKNGHYTCFIKNINNKWYHFDDTDVSEVKQELIISPNAYVLFYKMKKT